MRGTQMCTSTFNESLTTSVVPNCFKISVIIPVLNKSSCLNDYWPVALTSIVIRVFESLIKNNICSSIPDTLDPLQFVYQPKRPTEDAIANVLHSSLTHIDSNKGNDVKLLFIVAFSTTVSSKLTYKTKDWILYSVAGSWTSSVDLR